MNVRHHSHTLPAFLKVTLLVAVVAAIAGIALARRSIFPSTVVSSASVSAVKSEAVTPVAAQRQRTIANMEAELVTVTPHGFEPREITRPQGAFLLLIDNRSGLKSVEAQLNLAALKVLDLTMSRDTTQLERCVEFAAGHLSIDGDQSPRLALPRHYYSLVDGARGEKRCERVFWSCKKAGVEQILASCV